MIVAAFCPRLSRKVALAALNLMALSCVGVKPKTSKPQKHPSIRASESQIASVGPCLAKLRGTFRSSRRPLPSAP